MNVGMQRSRVGLGAQTSPEHQAPQRARGAEASGTAAAGVPVPETPEAMARQPGGASASAQGSDGAPELSAEDEDMPVRWCFSLRTWLFCPPPKQVSEPIFEPHYHVDRRSAALP